MKVLFTFGGLPHYYNLVLNKLNSIPGLEVVVVTPSDKGKTLGAGVHQSKEGIEFKVIYLDEYKTFYGKPFFKDFRRTLSEEKPDIIVTVWPYALALLVNPLLMRAIRKLKIKLIYKDIPFNIPKYEDAGKYYEEQRMQTENLNSNIKSNKILNTLKFGLVTLARKKYLNLMDAHVYYTNEAFEIIGSYGVPKERIFITYNSPDTDKLLQVKEKIEKEAPVLPYHGYRILHVGRLVKWKRVDMLIHALSKLKEKHPSAELLIIGTGPEEEELKKLVQNLNLQQAVTFIGGVYDPELLGKYFMASSIYVLAGMGGLSINEAMCFNKPVICSVCDGTEKVLVRDNVNGMFFEDGNEKDLTQKIDYLLSHQELLKTFGENSGKIIRDEVNIHTVMNGYVNAFNYANNNKYKIKYSR